MFDVKNIHTLVLGRMPFLNLCPAYREVNVKQDSKVIFNLG